MGGKLKGKVAIVTGASKGIGTAIARDLAAEGALVVVNYSTSKDGAEKIVKEIVSKGGKAIALQGNMALHEDIKRLVAETKKAFGRIDILVNNAGIYEFYPLEHITKEHYTKIFDLNVLGLILLTQEVVNHMSIEGGSIINISSIASHTSPPNTTIYSATKAAVDSITRSLAAELGPKKIRVNSVNPGMVITEGVVSAEIDKGDFRQSFESRAALGRLGYPEDVSPAVVFLASDDSKWITGTTLDVSGGYR